MSCKDNPKRNCDLNSNFNITNSVLKQDTKRQNMYIIHLKQTFIANLLFVWQLGGCRVKHINYLSQAVSTWINIRYIMNIRKMSA